MAPLASLDVPGLARYGALGSMELRASTLQRPSHARQARESSRNHTMAAAITAGIRAECGFMSLLGGGNTLRARNSSGASCRGATAAYRESTSAPSSARICSSCQITPCTQLTMGGASSRPLDMAAGAPRWRFPGGRIGRRDPPSGARVLPIASETPAVACVVRALPAGPEGRSGSRPRGRTRRGESSPGAVSGVRPVMFGVPTGCRPMRPRDGASGHPFRRARSRCRDGS